MFLTLLSCCLGRIAAPCAETLYGPPFFSRFFADAQNDIPCHHRRSRRRSEGSGAPHWFSTLAATGDFKGGCFLLRHWQMEKVEEQIPSWGIVVLCAETRFCRRLCARTFQYMLCMASSVRRGVSPATPLRTGFISKDAVSDGLRNRFTWGRDSLPELHTIPGFPSIVFHIKLCLSLISHTGFCR